MVTQRPRLKSNVEERSVRHRRRWGLPMMAWALLTNP